MKLTNTLENISKIMEEKESESIILLEKLKIVEGQLNILDIEIKKILNF